MFGLVGNLEIGMAVAESNSGRDPSTRLCNSYKVESLAETILGANQTSNLKDRYDLGEQLGWGQFGVIRACHNKFTGEVLACKSIAKDRLVTKDDMRSIKLEIEIMTRLSGHPNVVDLKAVYEEEDYVHLVMELCAGGELFHQLEKHGRFSEAEARILFRHLMQVVLYCHENGVVHRDLKPENILLATKASTSEIKLADFGLATYVKHGQSLHGTVGSPFYIAPEVLAGGYDQAADVWSAGVILYILLSTMPPFWGKTKSRIFDAVRAADLRFPPHPWDRVTESAKDLIRRMLCTDPRQRLTAEQVLDHSWMKDDSPNFEPNESTNESCGVLEFGGGSFSSFMSRNQDISFGIESPTSFDTPSPAFTCRSSFSPHFASGGFSFHSGSDSGAMEFSSPMPSMPSFSFFTPDSSSVEQKSCLLEFPTNVSTINNIREEGSLGKLLVLPEPSICLAKKTEGTNMSRIFHSKRNRTIGLGEREPFDLLVTESVIRWSSCTHLPTPISSLVC